MCTYKQRVEYGQALNKAWEQANVSGDVLHNVAKCLPLLILELVITSDGEFCRDWIEICRNELVERVVLGNGIQ